MTEFLLNSEARKFSAGTCRAGETDRPVSAFPDKRIFSIAPSSCMITLLIAARAAPACRAEKGNAATESAGTRQDGFPDSYAGNAVHG